MHGRLFVVSACLLGLKTRYDGGHNRCAAVLEFCAGHSFIPVCPEQLGGLPTPRPPAEISGGEGEDVLRGTASVLTGTNLDFTDQFLRGAEQVLLLARLARADGVILKARSPSCGPGQIYDGSFRGRFRPGDGVTAALLKKHGFPVYSELTLPAGNRDQ